MQPKAAVFMTISLLSLAFVGVAGAHGSIHQYGPAYYAFNHHRDVIAVETNLQTTGGMFDYGGNVRVPGEPPADTGLQLHDACVVAGMSMTAVYPSRGASPFYNYIIAASDPAGIDDSIDIGDATAYWASLGFDIADHDQMHEGCESLGGTQVHADLVVFTDEDLGGEGGEEQVDLRGHFNTVRDTINGLPLP